MPKVPQYNTNQVSQAAIPGLRVSGQVSRENFGAGQAFSNMMDEATKIAVQAKKEADDISVLDAQRKLAEFQTEFTYGKNGMASRRGEDSFTLKQELDEKYGKLHEEILNGFSNDQQRGLFAKYSMSRKNDMDNQVMRHISVERDRFDDEKTDAYIKTERGNAINNSHDPNAVMNSIRSMDISLMQYADRKGMSGEQAKQLIESNRGMTHAGIISSLVNKSQDIEAEKYFNLVKDQIPGDVRVKVEKELEIGSINGKAQRFVDAVMSKGVSEGQAYNLSKQVESPKLRDEIDSRIARQYKIKEAQENEFQKNLMERLIQKFDSNGELDVSAMAGLKPQYQEAFKRYRDYNPLKDDGVLNYKLNEKAINPKTREEFANEDLLKYIGSLSRSHFEALTKLQFDIKSGRGEKVDDLNGAYTDSQIIESSYRKAGYNPKKAEDFARFKLIVDQDIEKYKQQTGKKRITNDELESIVNKNTVKLKTDDFFFDLIPGRKKAKFEIKINDISKANQEMIRSALEKKNVVADDQKVIKYYILMKEQGLLND